MSTIDKDQLRTRMMLRYNEVYILNPENRNHHPDREVDAMFEAVIVALDTYATALSRENST